jgi:hypothetical protein
MAETVLPYQKKKEKSMVLLRTPKRPERPRQFADHFSRKVISCLRVVKIPIKRRLFLKSTAAKGVEAKVTYV